MILIAGPCVIESRELIMKVAESLRKFNEMDGVEFYFKSSFDKANRTSISSFRGPGLQRGCEILAEVKEKFGYKILTDIHESYQAEPVARVADVLQIPAFLCRQTDLLVAAAGTQAVVNIKKGQFLSPQAMKHSVEKVLQTRSARAYTPQSGATSGDTKAAQNSARSGANDESSALGAQNSCSTAQDAQNFIHTCGAKSGAENAAKAVIAYEPIWAIGTGKTATTAQAEEVCKAIRECIKEVYSDDVSEKIRIQYGGSVNAGNAAELFAEADLDGGLVGGASLKPDFGKIVNYK